MKYITTRHIALFVIFFSFLASCRKDPVPTPGQSKPANAYSSEIAQKWMSLEREMIASTPGFSPPVAARAFAYTSLSLYEAVVPGMPEHKSLVSQLNEGISVPKIENGKDYNWEASANAAFAEELRDMFKTANNVKLQRIDSLENALSQSINAQASAEVNSRSAAFGKSVATAIYQWSRTDGGDEGYLKNSPTSYSIPTGPGLWEQTSAALALQPYWGNNRPFLKETISQAAMAPPLAFSTDASSAFYMEAMQTYNAVKNATPEQVEIAQFWSDDPSTTSTPAGHSFSILAQVLDIKHSSLAVAAEAYAKLGVALNDAFICCWKDKYKYNLIRPITYINRYIDPNWKPLLSTPPFPEYASGHSVESSASATLMASFFGDNFSFDDKTYLAKGIKARHFEKFSDFAKEAAISRLYGGIHFSRAINEGLKEGQRIGQLYANLPTK